MPRRGRTPGVPAGRWAPGVGRRPPSGRSRDAAPAAGKTRAQRRGALVRGGSSLAPRSLGTPTPEPPRAAPGAPTARSASGALPAGVAARSLRGAARFPSGARGAPLRRGAPARACALLLFAGAKRNVHSFHSFSSRGPDSLRGGLGREQSCGLTSRTSLPPSAGTPAPEVEREARHSQCAPGARSRSSQLLAQPRAVVLEVGKWWWLRPLGATERRRLPFGLGLFSQYVGKKFDLKRCKIVPPGRQVGECDGAATRRKPGSAGPGLDGSRSPQLRRLSPGPGLLRSIIR